MLEALLHLRKTVSHLCLCMLDEVEVVTSFQPFNKAGKGRAVRVVVVDDHQVFGNTAHLSVELLSLFPFHSMGDVAGNGNIELVVWKGSPSNTSASWNVILSLPAFFLRLQASLMLDLYRLPQDLGLQGRCKRLRYTANIDYAVVGGEVNGVSHC